MRFFLPTLLLFLVLTSCQSQADAARDAARALGQKVCACSGSPAGSTCRQELQEQMALFQQNHRFGKADSALTAELRQIIRAEIRQCKAKD